MPEFKKNRNPILMKGTKGSPIHANYGSPMHDEKPTKEQKKEYKEFLDTIYADKKTREMKKEKRKYFKHYKKTGRKEAPPGYEGA
tara:strand:- start:50 stop:304 length:255 start_codon:yes stop_codon:yes gene_type:complete